VRALLENRAWVLRWLFLPMYWGLCYNAFLDACRALCRPLCVDLTGWGHARINGFPEIRSLGGGGADVGAGALPYVYLLARAAFLQQSATTFSGSACFGQQCMGPAFF